MIDWAALSAYSGPQASPGFLLWRDFMRWQRGLNEALRPFQLTQPQFAVLATCGWLTRDGQKLTQQGLADFLGFDRMHVSQIASRLESDGLLVRQRPGADRRRKGLTLTDKGCQRLAAVMPIVEAYDHMFFAAKPR